MILNIENLVKIYHDKIYSQTEPFRKRIDDFNKLTAEKFQELNPTFSPCKLSDETRDMYLLVLQGGNGVLTDEMNKEIEEFQKCEYENTKKIIDGEYSGVDLEEQFIIDFFKNNIKLDLTLTEDEIKSCLLSMDKVLEDLRNGKKE